MRALMRLKPFRPADNLQYSEALYRAKTIKIRSYSRGIDLRHRLHKLELPKDTDAYQSVIAHFSGAAYSSAQLVTLPAKTATTTKRKGTYVWANQSLRLTCSWPLLNKVLYIRSPNLNIAARINKTVRKSFIFFSINGLASGSYGGCMAILPWE